MSLPIVIKDNGKAIREVCRTFVALSWELDLLSVASVAIDGSTQGLSMRAIRT